MPSKGSFVAQLSELCFGLNCLQVFTTQEIHQRLLDVLWRVNGAVSARHVRKMSFACVFVFALR